mgnify:CR=1 FL=1
MTADKIDLQEARTIFATHRNRWKVRRADKISFIVDADDYFRTLRSILIRSKREVLLIGWDFDFEIDMLPGESDEGGIASDGWPNQLGPFLEAIVEHAPNLDIYMLKWNGAALIAPGRLLPTLALYAFGNERIHFALDGHHPFGACHHQKIVVADGSFAFCGGIDVTESRWDTSEHLPQDPRRKRKDGTISEPWHDATSVLTGPVAAALGDLSRTRWSRATGDTIARPTNVAAIDWPDDLRVDGEHIDVAIARTEPPYDGEPLVNEIENLTLASIAAAEKSIYIESQYFAAQKVSEALKSRLEEHDGPEIIVINPESALSQFEDQAMHVLRGRVINDLKQSDHQDRFRIYYPVNDADEAIYVHAKVVIVDDQILKIGSSNMNDRSMGFDTECDVAIADHNDIIAKVRTRLLSEHLNVQPSVVETTLDKHQSLIATIEQLNPDNGRRLRQIEQQPEGKIGKFLADTRMMDPRYLRGEATSTGEGVRPRHLAAAGGAGLLAVLGWQLWKRWKSSSDKNAKH